MSARRLKRAPPASTKFSRVGIGCSLVALSVVVVSITLSRWELALHIAAKTNDIDELKRLLDQGADPDSRDVDGCSPLHYAAGFGHVDLVTLLLDRDADPNAQNHSEETPLHWACTRSLSFEVALGLRDHWTGSRDPAAYYDAVVLLLARGASVAARDWVGETPLHEAADHSAPLTRLLLEHGADANARTRDERSPLHNAASGGVGVLRLLLDHGADVNAVDKWENETALNIAVHFDAAVVGLLIDRGADVHHRKVLDETPFSRAKKLEIIRILESHGGSK